MVFIETAEYSEFKKLYINNKGGYIMLFDEKKGFLGNFQVWQDSEHHNDEYFTLNGDKIYLDNIKEK